jgi:hypothetical protein
MTDSEYTDGYQPEHPELIPENPEQARTWVQTAIDTGISTCDTQTFLRAWWAFAWLNPGFHPDDCGERSELPHAKKLTEEAIRRAEAGEIDDDSQFYAAEASHNSVWLERIGSPNAPSRQP